MTQGTFSRTGRGLATRAGLRAFGNADSAFSRQWWLFAAPGIAASGIAALTLLLCILSGLFLDGPATLVMRGLSPVWVRVAADLTLLGLSGYMLVISAAIIVLASVFVRNRRRGRTRIAVLIVRERAAFVFATVAGSGIAAQIVKHIVGRSRPKTFDSLGAFHFDLFSIKASLASFPSGHATSAFAAATALGIMLPRWRIPLFIVACLVAASRVAVGAHFISDVMAGAALGMVFTLGLAAFFASRGWTFERRDGAVLLKDSGVIGAALAAARTSPERAA